MNSVVVWLLVSFMAVNGGSSQLLLARTPTEKACKEAKDAFIAALTASGERVSRISVLCSKAEVIVEGDSGRPHGTTYSRKENQ